MPRRISANRRLESAGRVHCRCRCRRLLRAIEAELEQLREENRLLRDSARFFAELSERLNVRLRLQRASQTGESGSPPATH